MNSYSLPAICVAAAASLVAGAQSASGAIITFTQQFVWEFYSQGQGAALSLETFDSYGGFYTGPLTGTSGGVNWSASAPGGLLVANVAGSPALSTNFVEPLTISFAGAPLQGVAGRFFGTDFSFNVVPALITLSLDDGSSFVGFVTDAAAFTGFYSTGAAITSISFTAQAPPGGSGAIYPTVDDLRFAVIPAPGALALLGVAGLVGFRRRR
jgi:hypothetical protein